MKLNGVQVVERFNIPGTLNRVVLRAEFLNNGDYVDPYSVSSVSIFTRAQNTSPSTVLASATQTISDTAASAVKFRMTGVKDLTALTTDASCASSIYKIDTGRYAVILDGTQEVSSLDRSGTTIINTASAAGDYLDIWTVKFAESADYTTVINNFKLYVDNFITLTEPALLRSSTRLIPNIVRLDEIVDLKVGTEITVLNKDISQNIKNLLTQSTIKDAQFLIRKHNEDHNLPSRVTVKSYSDTSADIRVTSDNTMVYSFNTASLTDNSITDLGAGTGSYSLQVKYTLLDETIVSPMMYFTVR